MGPACRVHRDTAAVFTLLFFFFSGSINNIQKVYKEKDNVVEALRGELLFKTVVMCSCSHTINIQ